MLNKMNFITIPKSRINRMVADQVEKILKKEQGNEWSENYSTEELESLAFTCVLNRLLNDKVKFVQETYFGFVFEKS